MENHWVLLCHRQGLAAWLFIQHSLCLSGCSQLLQTFLRQAWPSWWWQLPFFCQRCPTAVLLRGNEAAGQELGVLVLTLLGVIAWKRNPAGQPRGGGGWLSLAGISSCASANKGANGSWSPASKWLCADGLAEAVFLTQLGINGPFLPLRTSSTASLHFLPL